MKKSRTLHQQIPELRDALAKPKRERTGGINKSKGTHFGGGKSHRWSAADVKDWGEQNAQRAAEFRARELRYKLSRLADND